MKKALGKGLASLIPTGTTSISPMPHVVTNFHTGMPKKEVGEMTVYIEKIIPNRYQPRQDFAPEALRDLANSIKEKGIIQPLIVTQATPDTYELIAGERRLRAAKLAGLRTVPVVIRDSVSKDELLELALIENVQRENLNPIEEAQGYKDLADQFGYSQEEVSKKIGKSRSAVANTMRLLLLPKVIQDDVRIGRISSGHARTLLSLATIEEQLAMRERILEAQLNVRSVEKLISEKKTGTSSTKGRARLTPQEKLIVDEMTQTLATKVRLVRTAGGKGGRVEIEFYSVQDLDRVYNQIVKGGKNV